MVVEVAGVWRALRPEVRLAWIVPQRPQGGLWTRSLTPFLQSGAEREWFGPRLHAASAANGSGSPGERGLLWVAQHEVHGGVNCACAIPQTNQDDTMIDSAKPQDRLRDKLTETRDNIADMGHMAKDAVADKYHELKDRAAEQYEHGKEKVVALEENLANKVREAPMKSVLIAIGLGIGLGFLFRRR